MDGSWGALEVVIKLTGAIGVITALLLTWRTHSERATFEMIDRLYSLCHVFHTHTQNDWRLGHLMSIGTEDYERMKALVAKGLSEEQKRQCLVKERLLGIHVFMLFEQVYFQWAHSSTWFHRRRKAFLGEMLLYFTKRLLPNPRLLAFLEEDRTGESLHLEQSSRAYLEREMKPQVKADPEGPFAPGSSPRSTASSVEVEQGQGHSLMPI